MLLSCKDIKKSFGIDVILENISFIIEEGEKAAIVGVNGAGKTTLFRILTGEMSHDFGEITLRRNAKIGYLSQMMDLAPDKTVEEEFTSVFSELIAKENNIREMESKMGALNGQALDDMMHRYSEACGEFEKENGYEYKSRIRGVMRGLGFSDNEFELNIRFLSGGQKTRVSLGKLLLTSPDLLLLDEPTNHLDIDSVSWLEDTFLKNYPGSVLIISHDRYFLDKTVTKVIEIEHGVANMCIGNYTHFAYKKEIDREIKLKQYMDQQKEIKRQEDVIKQLRSFNREKSIKRAESREKMLAKMERVERPEDAPEKMRIILEPNKMSGNDVLSIEKLTKDFDGNVLFRNANIDVKRGEIVAIIGPNGVGKTTLFKMILDKYKADKEERDLEFNGKLKIGTNVFVGYFDQEYAQLDNEKTVFDEISDTYPRMKNVEIRNALAAFVFTGDDVFKKIGNLSGGEKGRVSLAKLMLDDVNLLMLDEPTNHLDMFSKEILEEALRNYTGTVIYISHDRYFINSTADKIVELTPDGTNLYLGNYDFYVEKKAEKSVVQQVTTVDKSVDADSQTSKDDWRRRKEEQAEERKRQNRIERIENEIDEAEKRLQEIEILLGDESVYTNATRAQEVYVEKTILEDKIAALLDEWENI